MKRKNDFALVPRPPSAVEKGEPGAKRILSRMVGVTLALAQKKPPRRIIHLDDDPDFLDLYRDIIQSSLKNVEVITFTDINAALKEISLTAPDLFITDLNMPKMDGLQVLSLLKGMKVKFPVMMLSSMTDSHFVERAHGIADPHFAFTYFGLSGTRGGTRKFVQEVSRLIRAECNLERQIVFSVLACTGEKSLVALLEQMIQSLLGEAYAVKVTDSANAVEIIELVKKQSFDLIIALVNNIHHTTADGEADSRILKVVELLAHLKKQHSQPIIALCAYEPETLDLPTQLRQAGIDAFLPTPFSAEAFRKALEGCLKTSLNQPGKQGESIPQPRKTGPPRIVLITDETWHLRWYEALIIELFGEATVLKFEDAREASQELLRADPDLFIMDLNRLGLDHFEMLRLLAERQVKYPILIAYPLFVDVEKPARECAGPNLDVTFWSKPGLPEELRRKLLKLIDQSDNPQRRILKHTG